MGPGTGDTAMEPPQLQKSPSVGAGPRRMRKVVTLQTAINLQETRVHTPLPTCVHQAGWATVGAGTVWDTGT